MSSLSKTKRKIPKYIVRAMRNAVIAANRYTDLDYYISKWFEDHGIDCEYNHLHCESVIHPEDVFNERMKCLKDWEKDNGGIV